MQSVHASDANRFFTITNYLQQVQATCFESCVVDFQTKDIGAMEKECAQKCVTKHMTIYRDLADKQ